MRMKRIFAALLIVAMTIACIPAFETTASASGMPYWIGVDVTNQLVTVYRASNNQVVKTMKCSTGLSSSPTPLGTYTMPRKSYSAERTEWYYFSEYKCYAKYASRIVGGILFHSVIYSQRNDSTLRRSTVNNLGSRASHGCVRLTVANAKWIAENCLAGTIVKIYNGKKNSSGTTSPIQNQTFEYGSTGSEVSKLQTRLYKLGFLNTTATGNYLTMTADAVKAFQAASGRAQDGIATPELRDAIYAAGAPTGTAVTLKKGISDSPAVYALQQALATAGYYTGALSSTYDTATYDAVKAFQRAYGINTTGTADSATQILALQVAGNPAITPIPTATPFPEPAGYYATVKIRASYLKVRAKPTTSSKMLGKLKKNTQVIQVATSGKWSQIFYNGAFGYVMTQYLVILGPNTTPAPTPIPTETPTLDPNATATPVPVITLAPTPVPTPTPVPVPAGNVSTVKISARYLNMRQKMSTSSRVMAKLKKQQQVIQISTSGKWSYIYANGVYGYVYTRYLQVGASNVTPAPTAVPTPLPTEIPTVIPTEVPATVAPTEVPTAVPTEVPVTPGPTEIPATPVPTAEPTAAPTDTPAATAEITPVPVVTETPAA